MSEVQVTRRVLTVSDEEKEKLASLSEMELLRLRQAEKHYQQSIANVLPGRNKLQHRIGQDIRDVTKQMGLAYHFLLAFIGGFLLGYYFCQIFIVDEI